MTEKFIDKNFKDLKLNAYDYKKMYERFKKYPFIYSEENMLRNTLLFLVPLSSMDATLQVIDKYGDRKDELLLLIQELFDNNNHNREEIIAKRDINTFGFKRLIKELDMRKQVR